MLVKQKKGEIDHKLQEKVKVPLSDEVLFGALVNGENARIDAKKGVIVLECSPTSSSPQKKKKSPRKKVDA